MDDDSRCALLNAQMAPGTRRRKANVVVDVAQVLQSLGIDTHVDLAREVEASSSVEWKVRAVSGVGAAAWRYMLGLSRVERVKPDTMLMRWLSNVGVEVDDQDLAARTVEGAVARLQSDGIDVTVRTIDHLIWRAASGRSLAGSA